MRLVVATILSLAVFAHVNGAQPPLEHSEQSGSQSIEIQQGTGYLGVGLLNIDEPRARELHLTEITGAEVSRVDSGSPAEKAGIHPGDVLLEFNGQRLESSYQLGRLVQETTPGHRAKLKVWRDGKPIMLVVTIEARKSRSAMSPMDDPDSLPMWVFPNPELAWRSGMIGIECESLSPQLADYFGVKRGVLVRTVLKNSPAERAVVKAGDVITKVADKPVTSAFELTSYLHNRSTKTVVLGVTRDHKEISISVTAEEFSPGNQPVKDITAQQ
jgi:serine protease Do